jgi:hypothetical protein
MNAMMLSSAATGLDMAGEDSILGNKLYRADDNVYEESYKM